MSGKSNLEPIRIPLVALASAAVLGVFGYAPGGKFL